MASIAVFCIIAVFYRTCCALVQSLMLKYVSCIKSSHDLCSPCVYIHVSARNNKCFNTFASVCYPVMIKALAGGEGKGMGIARNDDEASM